MRGLTGPTLAVILLLPVSTNSWCAPSSGFTYWGIGLESQEFGIELDLQALSESEPTGNASNVDNAYAFGTRFFAGYQFNNGLTLEAGAFGGVTPVEAISTGLDIERRKEFSIDAKAAYTLALSDYAFARAHLGTRFYTRNTFAAVAPTNEVSGWMLTQTKLATSDLTAGLGLGLAWGSERAVLFEYEALQSPDQTLHSFSMSLMIRI